MRKIKISKVLILGSGSIARRHYSLAKEFLPKAEVRVFSETGQTLSSAQMIHRYSDIIDFNPQLTVIATQTNKHLVQAIELAKMGSHLLIEKPISLNLHGIEQLLELKKEGKLQILVGYNLNFLPSLQFMSNCIESNQIGRVLDVRIEVGQDLATWRPERDYRESVSARRDCGGGVLRELSHEMNYLIELFGKPKWVIASTDKVSDLEVDVEDIAHITMGMTNRGNYNFMASIHLDFIRRDKVRNCTIIGTKGTLDWDIETGEIIKKNSSISKIVLMNPTEDSIPESYRTEWRHLINAINDGDDSKNLLRNSLITLEMILACEESQSTGQRIQFTPREWSF